MYLKSKWNRYFLKLNRKLFFKKSIQRSNKKKTLKYTKSKKSRLHKLFSLLILKSRFNRGKRRYYKKNLIFTHVRRKVFFYLGPFFITRLFFSKLIRARVLKRLSTVW